MHGLKFAQILGTFDMQIFWIYKDEIDLTNSRRKVRLRKTFFLKYENAL